MGKASRAIIFNGDKLLVMFRNKHGSQYYTLVGGRIDANETPEQALAREVKEETGMDVTGQRLVYYEDHPEPYNKQYIFLTEVRSTDNVAIQDYSEEGHMNKLDMNIHKPMWANISSIAKLPFRTPQLQQALMQAVKKGFPEEPVKL